jgi:hypothetical protein
MTADKVTQAHESVGPAFVLTMLAIFFGAFAWVLYVSMQP